MNSMYQQLMQLPLFQGVSTEKITSLVEKLPFHFLKYRNGEQVLTMGDACTHIKFVVSGKVRVEMPCAHLRVTIEQTLTTPNVLAPEYLFGRETVYPFSVYADGPWINSDKVFLFNILNYLSSGSQRSVSSSLSVKDGSVSERLAILVQSLVIAGASDVILRYKQKDLCALLGTQRTTLITMLDKLSDDGIVEYDSNAMTVLDMRKLMDINK